MHEDTRGGGIAAIVPHGKSVTALRSSSFRFELRHIEPFQVKVQVCAIGGVLNGPRACRIGRNLLHLSGPVC